MKSIKLTVVLVCTLLIGPVLKAQNIYEAQRYSSGELNGTARFVGMGGAMGALGGDISTMNTNPAGIGIYRSNDVMFSFGFNNTVSNSDFAGNKMNADKWSGSFDNAGFVYSNKIGNYTALKYVNFGFNYQKKNNFNKSILLGGDSFVSQTDQIALMCNRPGYEYGVLNPDALSSKEAFTYNDVPWLGALAYGASLINPYEKNQTTDEYLGYLPDKNATINQLYRSKESGGIQMYDFNVAFNINDMFYIGGTLGIYNVDYTLNSEYSETFYVPGNSVNQGSYTLRNRFKTEGNGVDFKLGMIIRPVSSFRIGFAVHTPTFYNLTDRNMAWVDYNTYNIRDNKFVTGTDYTQDEFGQEWEGQTDYKLITPWKFNLSLGYTIGKSIAIGAEYEYQDYSTAKLKKDIDGYVEDMSGENAMMNQMLKGVHTLKLGVEAKLVPQFSVRAGYNYNTAAFHNDASKILPDNTIYTNTEYNNVKAMNAVTLGMGYRGAMFYADLAYQFSTYKSDFYSFNIKELAAAKVTNDRHQLIMTLGLRF